MSTAIEDGKRELLRFENISVNFDRGVQALSNVSFSFYAGETLGIIGESGSGKSTIAKLIMGLQEATSGRIFACNREVTNASRIERKKLYQSIQMVFQDAAGSFNPRRRIGSVLGETVCQLCGESESAAAERVAALLADVGLPAEYAAKYPHELSGGECQRAAIARAMAVHPEILVCDEATSALDVSAQARIMRLLLHLQVVHSVSLIFITHDLPLVSNIADRLLILEQGRIVESGPTEEIIRNPQQDYTKKLLAAVL